MKSFRFPLDRVLDWRRTELDMEEARLKRMYAGLAAIDLARAELESARDEASHALLARATVDGAELQLLSGYRDAVKLQCVRLDQKRRESEQEAAAQQQKLLAVRQRVRLLENLKERRLAEWQAETERQIATDAPPRNGPFRAPPKLCIERNG